MEVTFLDQVRLSGPVTEFPLLWSGTPGESATPLTFNQRNHLAAAKATGRSTWIGGMLDIGDSEGWSDTEVAAAVLSAMSSAPALRSVARSGARQVFPSCALSVTSRAMPSAVELSRLISTRCAPGDTPGIFAARIGITLIVAVDHFHADMLSIDILLRRLWDALQGKGTQLQAGSPAQVRSIDSLDPLIASEGLSLWQKFFCATGGCVPSFPITLASQPSTPVHDIRHLLSATMISGELDRRTFAVLLTVLAEALETVTGSPTFAIITPVHTRGRRGDPRHNEIGWMVGNAPVIAHARDVEATHQWLRDAITVVKLPIETMIDHCTPEIPPGVIPMVSYIDFRGRDEADVPGLPRPRYISSTSPTDTVQLWFSRTHGGLALRAKYPTSPESRQIMDRVFKAMEDGLSRYCGPELTTP